MIAERIAVIKLKASVPCGFSSPNADLIKLEVAVAAMCILRIVCHIECTSYRLIRIIIYTVKGFSTLCVLEIYRDILWPIGFSICQILGIDPRSIKWHILLREFITEIYLAVFKVPAVKFLTAFIVYIGICKPTACFTVGFIYKTSVIIVIAYEWCLALRCFLYFKVIKTYFGSFAVAVYYKIKLTRILCNKVKIVNSPLIHSRIGKISSVAENIFLRCIFKLKTAYRYLLWWNKGQNMRSRNTTACRKGKMITLSL